MRLLGGTRLSSLVLCLVLASLSLEADAQARRQLIDRDPEPEVRKLSLFDRFRPSWFSKKKEPDTSKAASEFTISQQSQAAPDQKDAPPVPPSPKGPVKPMPKEDAPKQERPEKPEKPEKPENLERPKSTPRPRKPRPTRPPTSKKGQKPDPKLDSDDKVSALQASVRDKYILRLPTDCGDSDCLPSVQRGLLRQKCTNIEILPTLRVLIAKCPSDDGEDTKDTTARLAKVTKATSVVKDEVFDLLPRNERTNVIHEDKVPEATAGVTVVGKDSARRTQVKAAAKVDYTANSPFNWGLERIQKQSYNSSTVPPNGISDLTVRFANGYQGLSGDRVDVMIMDSGIRFEHPQFANFAERRKISLVASGVNESATVDLTGHGTHVASIAVGSTIGVARNPRLTLISYKVMDGLGYGTFESVVEGLDYAANRAKDNKRRLVVNLSFSFGGVFPEIDDMIDSIAKQYPNIIFVACAGNEQTANFGDAVEMYAPGVSIIGAVSLFDVYGALYANRDGTSQAAPFVTGMIALLMSQELAQGKNCRCDHNLAISQCSYVKFLTSNSTLVTDPVTQQPIPYPPMARLRDGFTC